MNEFLRNFIMTGIRDMIKNGVALYQTYQYASGWFNKEILTQEDLEEIQSLYEQSATNEEENVALETDSTKVDSTEQTEKDTNEIEGE
jgi:hypothetical protein